MTTDGGTISACRTSAFWLPRVFTYHPIPLFQFSYLVEMPLETNTEKDSLTVRFRNFTLGRGSKTEDDKRRETIRELEILYQGIKTDGGGYFDVHGLDLYNTKFRELALDKKPTDKPDTFFTPMSMEDLNNYPPDLTHEETKKRVERLHLIWEERDYPDWFKEMKKHDSANQIVDRHRNAERLCNFMVRQFAAMKRKVPNTTDRTTLRMAAGWNYSCFGGSLVDDEFCNDLFDSSLCSLMDPFVASEGRPHVMISIAQGFKSDQEALYRHELLSILAVMISQLKKPLLKKHKVIPVKAISFTGWDGRIIEAHYNSDVSRLIVHASDLFDFSSADVALKNAELFLRHMASGIAGNTTNPIFTPM